MKTRTLVSILILILSVLIIAGSCATEKKMVKKSEELYGTWVNEDYADVRHYTTLVFTSDGTYEFYTDASRKTLSMRGTHSITDKWTDSEGNFWYKATYEIKIATQPVSGFLLIKISNSGTTYEDNYDYRKYPTEIDPIYGTYSIYYRQ